MTIFYSGFMVYILLLASFLLACQPVNSAASLKSAKPSCGLPQTAGRSKLDYRRNYNPQIEVGPFDIHKKYRSMEGPYTIQTVLISDLINSGHLQIPASMITYLDGQAAGAPAMIGASAGQSGGRAPGLIESSNKQTELLWFAGIKIQVLDENDRPMPDAEFMCHLNVDVDQVTRYMQFPELERTGNSRIITLTQGQTEFYFPEGFAVPVSSDEAWKFTFQAANRTTNSHRRVKHLCTLSFVRDSDLKKAPKALHWYNRYIAVQVKADSEGEKQMHSGPACLQISSAENAPNMVAGTNFKDSQGRVMSPHWTVPPGSHKFQMPVNEQAEDSDFSAEDHLIHAVWTHVHPACTNAALLECIGDNRRKIFNVNASTFFTKGPELKHIDKVLSKEGIPLKAGQNYELAATYNNPTKEALDSMVVFGIFCESRKFVRPDWIQDQPASQPDRVGVVPCAAPLEQDNGRLPWAQATGTRKSAGAESDVYCGIRAPSK